MKQKFLLCRYNITNGDAIIVENAAAHYGRLSLKSLTQAVQDIFYITMYREYSVQKERQLSSLKGAPNLACLLEMNS